MRKLDTKIFIERAIIKHNNYYTYTNTIYTHSHNDVVITCPVHKEFKQQASKHLEGYGCRECGLDSMRISTNDFIIKAQKIHKNYYDYSLTKYTRYHENLIIICPKHGQFSQEAGCHLSGAGCNKCAVAKNADACRSTTEEFIIKANSIHNNKYDYSLVNYINNITPVNIICKIHKPFDQTPMSHLMGSGCPICGTLLMVEATKYTHEEIIKKFNEVHKSKYDYSKFVFINVKVPSIIICPIHKEFNQMPDHHIHGHGCNQCGIELISKKLRSCTKDFIEKSIIVHKDKYDYSKVEYIDNTTEIIIICNKHGEFKQKPVKHLCGHGCSKCGVVISKPEIAWLDSLGIPEKYRQKHMYIGDRFFKFDAYDPITNTVYEHLGDFWHGNPNSKFKSDDMNPKNKKSYGALYKEWLEKERIIKLAGYNLITIWESDWLAQKKNNKE